MARFVPISVEVDGRTYTGDYEVVGEKVRVGSAYGAATVRAGRADPAKAARAALADLVLSHLRS